MSTYENNTAELEKIDITAMLFMIWNSFRKIWYIFLFIPLIFGMGNYFRVSRSYTPTYVAEATVSVAVVGTDGTTDNNIRTAEQLGKVFPYILTSSALRDIIADSMNMSYVPGNISVTNVKGTNLLTIRVSGSDPQKAYDVLQLVIQKYPDVSQHVVGGTVMEVIDDSGVPSDTGKTRTLRGSIKNGAIAGLVLAAILLVIYMFSYKTVLSSADLKNMTNVPYLGTLPVYHKKKRRNSEADGINILKENTQKNYLEAMRIIRTRLARDLDDHQVLLVTSSIPGEGKSTVAVNLAISYAMQGKSVVLIDCDLRNPSVLQVLNLKREKPGLGDYLAGKCQLTDTFISYAEKGIDLTVIAGSEEMTDNPELLRKKAMKEAIQVLRESADLIILDTPPSAMLADAEILVKYADKAVYVVMCDYVRSFYIRKGIRELSETGIDISGVILNAGRQSSSSGYGYYGKSYYGKTAGQ